jgi:GNAT superfamily N-acetyltransferase
MNAKQKVADRLPDGYDGPIEITDPAALEEIYRLRAEAWKSEADWLAEKPDANRIADRHDDAARHWVVRHGGDAIAAIRLSLHDRVEDMPDFAYFPAGFALEIPPPLIYSARLVVAPAHRHQGIAGYLDQFVIQMARQVGARAILGMVPPYRIRGLSRLGFVALHTTHHPYAGEIPSKLMLLDLR